MMKREEASLRVEGHVKIYSYEDSPVRDETGKLLDARELRVELDKRNAVHDENMSIAIARSMGGSRDGAVFTMHFGTGGATVDPLGNIIYATPNVQGAADLNTPIFFEVVDQNRGAPPGNQMAVRHINATNFADLEIRCVLDKNTPIGQDAFDNQALNLTTGAFVFNEIGLKTDDQLLLTHITFSPIQKSANRIFEIIYTLRYRVS